jgi:glycosyltransferase involved in cell wall biosynthesis
MTCVNHFASKVVLLLTPVDMTKDAAGQLYLKALTSTAPSIRVITFRLPEGGYLEYSSGAGRISRTWTSLASRFGAWQTLKISLYARKQLIRDTQQAQELLRSHEAESCWITLSSPECILLAHELMKSGVKIRVTVWDAPEHVLSSQNICGAAAEGLLRRFAEVLRGAASVSVISANMQEHYKVLFDIEAVVIRPVSVPPERNKTPRKRRTLRLVFAGSLYAKVEWNALLKSLKALQWRIANRRVVIYFLGAFPLRGASWDRHVKQLGHLPAAEAAAICRKCDVAYLPYWLTGDNALVAATSFPSKLALYLSSGLPVLNHGPQTSEVTRIMRNYDIGVSCHSLAADNIAAALEALAHPTIGISTQQAICKLVQSELSPESVGRRFVEFMTS